MDNKGGSINSLTSVFPIMIAIVYICGYVITTGYLFFFGIYNDDVVNLNFLKAGIVFLLPIFPILVLIYHDFTSQEQKNLSFFNSSQIRDYLPSYLLLISFLYLDYSLIETTFRYTIAVSIIIIGFLYSLTLFRVKNKLFVGFSKIYLPFIFIVILQSRFQYLFEIHALIFLSCYISYTLLRFYKSFTFDREAIFIILVLLSAFYFGFRIYPHIPYYFGGGKSYKTTLLLKKESISLLKNVGLNINEANSTSEVEFLYSKSEKYVFKQKDLIFDISKELFNGTFIKKTKSK